MTKIEWTEATWNPLAGCSILSPGCTHCYAMRMAHRLAAMGVPHYQGLTRVVNGNPVWTGKLNIAPDHIVTEPLRRKKPTMYFVNSMSDLFHEDVPDAWVLRVLDVIRSTSHDGGANCGTIRHRDRTEGQHVYQLLTKRSARMRKFMSRLAWDGEQLHLRPDTQRARVILHNLWLGVSAERQKEAAERIPDLLATPATVRFVSAEPLLGPIDFGVIVRKALFEGGLFSDGKTHPLGWIIVGGESGPGARPMHPEWARSIRDQCEAAGVPFFFKQWGSHARAADALPGDHLPEDADIMVPTSKKRAGRLLDGKEHSAMPAI